MLSSYKNICQSDDTIRFLVHSCIYNYIKYSVGSFNSLGIFLGGEFYIYGRVFDHFVLKKYTLQIWNLSIMIG